MSEIKSGVDNRRQKRSILTLAFLQNEKMVIVGVQGWRRDVRRLSVSTCRHWLSFSPSIKCNQNRMPFTSISTYNNRCNLNLEVPFSKLMQS